ncbi:MAG: translation initiation factor IF-2 [Candidatus Omnitrophica bacterium]|nr:translation initiation factor IF-2 [Candidatus Omnitrophota bacterium]
MSIKVCVLAKELGVPSEEVLEQLRRLYIDVDDEKSTVDEKIASLIKIKLGGRSELEKPVKKAKKVTPEAPSKDKKTKQTKKTLEEKVSREPKKTEIKKEKEKEKEKEEKIPVKEEKKAAETPAAVSPIRVIFSQKEAEKAVAAPEEIAPRTEETSDLAKESAKIKEIKKVQVVKPAIEVVEKTIPHKKFKKYKKANPDIEVVEKSYGKIKSWQGTMPASKKDKEAVSTAAQQSSVRKTHQKVEIQIPVGVRDLAPKINVKPSAIIQFLMGQGMMVTINQVLEEDIARVVMEHFGYDLVLPDTVESIQKELVDEHQEEEKKHLEPRAPVVTFMGHVDHGKTSLLDYIRKTMVTKSEKGGITQHIGAYRVETSGGAVTFLDTPGHAAFTAMRARGANATDVVVLVVAADDGVMPQTKEAIDHARAANVPIVVAINKCDLPGANPDRVKADLHKEGLMSEEWGGKTIMVEVSAITGEGVDKLIEMLMLEAEMLELKASPKLRARGVVIESKKTPDQGVVVTLLVQNGTLKPGDIVLCGAYYGKVKAMINDRNEKVEAAFPSMPVEVLGLQGVPEAGEEFFIVKDEKKAKTLSLLKQGEDRRKKITGNKRVTLEDFHSQMKEGAVKELKIVLKADVQGSVEALKYSMDELKTDEVRLVFVHTAVGNINESDVMLALVSNAIIIGFHVKVDPQAEEIAKSENVDIHVYDIIYEAIADVKAGLEGLLEPEEREVYQGTLQVLEVFSASKIGKAAGGMVTKGTVHRKDRVRVKRGQEVIFQGEINSLRRFKDDVKDVKEGFECGISVKNFPDVRKNDIIEAYIIEKIARRLEK